MFDMQRFVRTASALLASAGLAGSVLGVNNAAAAPGAEHRVNFGSRVHPLLQVGAQAEPDKKVRVTVSKTASFMSSQAIAKAVDAAVVEEFPATNTLVLELPQKLAARLDGVAGVGSVNPVAPVGLDSIDATNLKTEFPGTIGAPNVWNGQNGTSQLDGSGITVAVVDTGINANLADFSGRVMCVDKSAAQTGCGDGHGHGTHVAGIIGGRDTQGRYIGVAPKVRIISVKVTDNNGQASAQDLVRGLQWVYDNRNTYNIRVANVSMGAAVAESYKNSAVDAYVEQLMLNGVTVVTSVGNKGNATDAVYYAPGNDPFVVSVGALDETAGTAGYNDSLAYYSSRGTTQDGYRKPEVIAPGRQIPSTSAGSTSVMAKAHPERVVDTNYIKSSGTSMAAPVVTGSIALLLQKYPSLTPDQVKWLIVNTTSGYGGQTDSAGYITPSTLLQRIAQSGLGAVGKANVGLVPQASIGSGTTTVNTSSYWNQSYWNQSYWNQSYWNQQDQDVY
jgi:serine protease AprX